MSALKRSPSDITAVSVTRTASKSGWIKKKGGLFSNWKSYFFCFIPAENKIYYFVSEKDAKPKGVIEPVRAYDIVVVPKEGECYIDLKPKNGKGKTIHLYLENKVELESWACSLEKYSRSDHSISIEEITVTLNTSNDSAPVDPNPHKSKLLMRTFSNKDISQMKSRIMITKLDFQTRLSDTEWIAANANNNTFAVKACRPILDKKSEDESKFFHLVAQCCSFVSSHFTHMNGLCEKSGMYCSVEEYVTGQDLSAFVESNEKGLGQNQIIDIAIHIVEAMMQLEIAGFTHGNLESSKIIIGQKGELNITITEFERVTLAITYPSVNIMEVCNVRYGAPEITEGKFTSKTDVFSLALILWEMVTGKKPWDQIESVAKIRRQVLLGNRPPIPADCPPPLATLIDKCWQHNPDKRPSFFEILEHLQLLQRGGRKSSSSPDYFPLSAHSPRDRRSSSGGRSYSNPLLPGSRGSSPNSGSPISRISPGNSRSNSNALVNPMKMTPDERIVVGYGNETWLPWTTFVMLLQSEAGVDTNDIQHFRYMLDKDGRVDVEDWRRFISWFLPLEDMRMSLTQISPEHFSITEMLHIISRDYFVGFRGMDQVETFLEKEPVGTFLIQFGIEPQMYNLYVKLENHVGVGKWNLEFKKKGRIELKIGEKLFSTIPEFVEHYTKNPLLLANQNEEYFLRVPFDRTTVFKPE